MATKTKTKTAEEELERLCPPVLKSFDDNDLEDILIRATHKFHPDYITPKSLQDPATHKKTTMNCRVVSALAGYGATKREIAAVLGCTEKIVDMMYNYEFEGGRDIANTRIKKKIYDLCLEGDTKMLTLYAKTQLGWKETHVNENNINITLTKEQRDAMAKAAIIDV